MTTALERFDAAIIDRIAEPASAAICSAFKLASCLDLALMAMKTSSFFAVMFIVADAATTGFDTTYVLDVTFCAVMMLLAIWDNRRFEKAVKPYADRAREDGLSWALPPFRVTFFRNRMICMTCLVGLVVFVSYCIGSGMSHHPVPLLMLCGIMLCRQVAQYFAACRPRPPASRQRSRGWFRNIVPAGM